MRSVLALLLVTSVAAPAALAQGLDMDTRFMMLNQHKCNDMAGVMDLTRTLTGPVLDELKDEGMIHDWGVLTHAWGDDWNYNFFMVTDDHASFVEAWSAFGSRVSERDPDWFERFGPMCQEHKDNLYTLHSVE